MKRTRGYVTRTLELRVHESLGAALLDDLTAQLKAHLRDIGGEDAVVTFAERGAKVKVWIETRETFKARTQKKVPEERRERFGSTGTFVRTYR